MNNVGLGVIYKIALLCGETQLLSPYICYRNQLEKFEAAKDV